MNRTQTRFVAQLQRRMNHLRSRVAQAESRGIELSFDKQEHNAICFALACIDLAAANGLIDGRTGVIRLQESANA